jgi:6-phosphogluconolactonase
MTVEIHDDAAAVFAAGADRVAASARQAVATRGRFTIALSGGSTPRGLYQQLVAEPRRGAMPWSSTHVFWGDERHVPPTDADSNYRMAVDALLSHAPIPSQQIHRIKAEESDARVAALMYEHDLREVFQIAPGVVPRFDCILLGLGGDGHTASLFPGTAALDVVDRLVVANDVPQMRTDRITLTFPVLNAAALVLFLVEGAGKSEIVPQVFASGARFPAARVKPASGDLVWMLDRAAAAKLPTNS